jgi:hypothetical protein
MIEKINVNFKKNSLKSFFGLVMISLANVLGQSFVHMAIDIDFH